MITGMCSRLVCFSYTHTHIHTLPIGTHTHTHSVYSKSHYKINFTITKFQKTVLEHTVAVPGYLPGNLSGTQGLAKPAC